MYLSIIMRNVTLYHITTRKDINSLQIDVGKHLTVATKYDSKIYRFIQAIEKIFRGLPSPTMNYLLY